MELIVQLLGGRGCATSAPNLTEVWGAFVCPRLPSTQVILWYLLSSMYLPLLDRMQTLIVLSPLFAELAIEPGCESCCIEGDEYSGGFVELGGVCCVPCAIDAAECQARLPASVEASSLFLFSWK
jgi:hypothetical protein